MDYDLLLINVSRDQSGLSGAFKDSIGQYLIASYLRQRDFKAFVLVCRGPESPDWPPAADKFRA